MKIKAKILIPHVYVLSFETQYELCMSFVRMQEFYESPKFRGKYFTLEQYMDHWSKEFGNGSFTYPAVWNGFNIPGNVIGQWMAMFKINEGLNLREREKNILKQIEKLLKKEKMNLMEEDIKRVYIIGTHKEEDDSKTIEHELAHAMYSLYPEYRNKCKKLLKSVPKEEYHKVKQKLIEMGYCNKMIDDETQAYFSTETLSKNGNVLSCRVEFIHNFNGFKEKIS